jgi:hypothetical protein
MIKLRDTVMDTATDIVLHAALDNKQNYSLARRVQNQATMPVPAAYSYIYIVALVLNTINWRGHG